MPLSNLNLLSHRNIRTSATCRMKQASAFQLQPGIMGEVRLVERAFRIGPEMMSESMSLHGAELEQFAIQQGF